MPRRDPSNRERFGQALRQARLELGMSQEELAERSELHRVFISELERGIKSPTLDAITALSEALGKKPSELLQAAEEQP